MELRRRNSICYMSLADAFLTRLRQEAESRTKSRMRKGVTVEVVAVTQSRQDFVYSYLTKLDEEGLGTFSKPKNLSRQIIYECERSSPCRGSSTGDPTKTRANGCSAYVSFIFEEGATVTACVVRTKLTHTGHDPNNREESRVSRIDLKLRFLIETQLNAGMKVSGVMSEVARWNKLHENTDHHNRRYFPTRNDIQQMALTLRRPDEPRTTAHAPRKRRKYDTLGKDNATGLLRTELRDWCVFYQSRTTAGPNPRPLMVVLQSDAMREDFMRCGEVVYVMKNFEGLCEYGSAVYVLAVSEEEEGTTQSPPAAAAAAYIVTSDDKPTTFLDALTRLHAHCPLSPKVLLMDQELQGHIEAVSTLLPDTLFLIPWIQVAQEVYSWVQACQESGKEGTALRRMLLESLQQLKASQTKEEFVDAVDEMEGREGMGEYAVLWVKWLSHPARWSDFGRVMKCVELPQSASWERCFLKLQYKFLKGVQTIRALPDLLKLLTKTLSNTKSVCSDPAGQAAEEHAALLVKGGWSQLITWQGEWEAHITCHTQPHTSYLANLLTMVCQCPAPVVNGPCVHLHLLNTVGGLQQGETVYQSRERVAREVFEKGCFVFEKEVGVTFFNGGVCVTDLATEVCTCVAASFGSVCVGVLVTRLAREGQTHTPTHGRNTTNPARVKTKNHPPSTHQPIIIKTRTGLPTPPQNPNPQPLSTKAILEQLYLWSKSEEFTNSNTLHGFLKSAYDTAFPVPEPLKPTLSDPREAGTRGNRKLRAVVRPVSRRRKEEGSEG